MLNIFLECLVGAQPREWLYYSASQWAWEDSLTTSSYHLGTGFES